MGTNFPTEHVNTGVSYFRNSNMTTALMKEWLKKALGSCKGYNCGDQEALSNVFRQHCGGFEVKKKDFFVEDREPNDLRCNLLGKKYDLKVELLPPGKFTDSRSPR